MPRRHLRTLRKNKNNSRKRLRVSKKRSKVSKKHLRVSKKSSKKRSKVSKKSSKKRSRVSKKSSKKRSRVSRGRSRVLGGGWRGWSPVWYPIDRYHEELESLYLFIKYMYKSEPPVKVGIDGWKEDNTDISQESMEQYLAISVPLKNIGMTNISLAVKEVVSRIDSEHEDDTPEQALMGLILSQYEPEEVVGRYILDFYEELEAMNWENLVQKARKEGVSEEKIRELDIEHAELESRSMEWTTDDESGGSSDEDSVVLPSSAPSVSVQPRTLQLEQSPPTPVSVQPGPVVSETELEPEPEQAPPPPVSVQPGPVVSETELEPEPEQAPPVPGPTVLPEDFPQEYQRIYYTLTRRQPEIPPDDIIRALIFTGGHGGNALSMVESWAKGGPKIPPGWMRGYDRLVSEFPDIEQDEIVSVLVDENGHAGNANEALNRKLRIRGEQKKIRLEVEKRIAAERKVVEERIAAERKEKETMARKLKERITTLSSMNKREDPRFRFPKVLYGKLKDVRILEPGISHITPHKYIANYDQYMSGNSEFRISDIVEYEDVDQSKPLSNPNRTKWKLAYVLDPDPKGAPGQIRITEGLNEVSTSMILPMNKVHRAPHREYYERISDLLNLALVEVRNAIDDPWSKAVLVRTQHETGETELKAVILDKNDKLTAPFQEATKFNEIRRAYSDLEGNKMPYEFPVLDDAIRSHEAEMERVRGTHKRLESMRRSGKPNPLSTDLNTRLSKATNREKKR